MISGEATTTIIRNHPCPLFAVIGSIYDLPLCAVVCRTNERTLSVFLSCHCTWMGPSVLCTGTALVLNLFRLGKSPLLSIGQLARLICLRSLSTLSLNF